MSIRPPQPHRVFITGATGYIGSRLIPVLLSQGHRVTTLTRKESRHKLPEGCNVASGNALDGDSYRDLLKDCDTFVQLAGVAHPGPAKARQFVEIDLKAGVEAVQVARAAAISHFIYVGVAHPAPMMQAFIDVRSQCERALMASGLNSTILSPWYVLGPGHRWPYLLIPFYKIAEVWPSTRSYAKRLGLVIMSQMIDTLVHSVENPPQGIRIVEVPEIKSGKRPTE